MPSSLREIVNAAVAESALSNFIEAARRACREIEGFDSKNMVSLSALTGLLDAAEALIDCKLVADDSDLCIENVDIPACPPLDMVFYVVFDPLDQNSVTAVSLKDCLGDIYGSLKGGLRVLDQSPEKRLAVLWEWRNDYQFHWGRHLVDAVRFLMLSKATEVRAGSS